MEAGKVKIQLGLDGAFLTRRWEEPESFMQITKKLGYSYYEFCADVLDPFFSGDRCYQMETARKVKEAAREYHVEIVSFFTGMATYRFHGLSHSNPTVQMRMREWYSGALLIAVEMGVKRIGGHFNAISSEVLADPLHASEARYNLYRHFRDMAKEAKDKGLQALYNEQMYAPSLTPWTLEQAEQFLIEVNKGNEGVPVYLTVDTGHAAGANYGAKEPDTDFRQWLRKFASVSEIIHLQQTTPETSQHWPFTKKYNDQGHVRIDEVLEAIKYSHENFGRERFAEHLSRVETNYLMVEVIPETTKPDNLLLDELKETADYLRQFIPEEGLQL